MLRALALKDKRSTPNDSSHQWEHDLPDPFSIHIIPHTKTVLHGKTVFVIL
jgi:hypothetical protein